MARMARLLLVTDVHSRMDNLMKLVTFMTSSSPRRKVDAILCAGDLVNVPNEPGEKEAKEDMLKHHEEASQVLNALCLISPNVYFIPGNHDPPELFKEGKDIVTKAKNVHKRVVELFPGLSLAGLGGSVDAYNLGGGFEWNGYPYTEDNVMSELESISTRLGKDDQVLLMTHFGPSNSGTTLIEKDPRKGRGCAIDGGSASLRRYLEDKQDSPILLNYHGHTHFAWGIYQMGRIPIIQPGPMRDGKFAFLELEKTKEDKWAVIEYIFKRLP